MNSCSALNLPRVTFYPCKTKKTYAKCLLKINGITIAGILIKKGQREMYVKYPKVLQLNPDYQSFLSKQIVLSFMNHQQEN